MKIQIATLVLAEREYLLFKIHLHDDLRSELTAKGEDQKDYLRDRLSRCLRNELGDAPWFFFMMEDLTKDREPTRPHAHGSIELPRVRLPAYGKPKHLHFARKELKEGTAVAERAYGQFLIKRAMERASGNAGDRSSSTGGVNQRRNVWIKLPEKGTTNHQWVTYAFKNVRRFSLTLGERRLAFPHAFCRETRNLWELIRLGEDAMVRWT
jgi:hypothetical protein